MKESLLPRITVLTKRQYMHKDLIDDKFGRFREIPLALSQKGHEVFGICLSYVSKKEKRIGWYYQQLLKQYAPFVIPKISSNVLILEPDTIFLKQVTFMN